MGKKMKKYANNLEKLSMTLTHWMGTPWSVLVHTLIFLSSFVTILLGFDSSRVMLILTTAVSLEAIYLSLFIQMTVNRNTESLEEVEEDVEDIEEDTQPVEAYLKDIDHQLAHIRKLLDK